MKPRERVFSMNYFFDKYYFCNMRVFRARARARFEEDFVHDPNVEKCLEFRDAYCM
jgi:hypothetical protein